VDGREDVARGPGPAWFRASLVGAALLYYVALIDHPRAVSFLAPFAYFTQATELFPHADADVLEYHLEAWSCELQQWQPLDPRAYFPLHGDDKESRFQRIAHFYDEDPGKHGQTLRLVMHALDDYVLAHHAAIGDDDGVHGPIGGIHMFKTLTPIPSPGDEVARYEYRPLRAVPVPEQRELYHSPMSRRRALCAGRTPPPWDEDKAPAPEATP
jgi:hypothetical protein